MDFSQIFKAYDVRGLAPEQLNREMAVRIGAAFSRFAAVDEISIGHDCRMTSPELVAGLIEGITGQGTNVALLGEITTDMLYFAAGVRDQPGVVVTASHNPSEYNGMKFCLAGAAPVGAESGLVDIEQWAADGIAAQEAKGTVTDVDVRSAYVEHVLTIVGEDAIGPLKVAVDGGNGMAGVALPQVFDRIAATLDALYLEPDGTFPNHPADPLRPENLVDLLALVDRTDPDIGVAFDGDADRAFFIDEQGSPLPGSTTTAIVAEWYLKANPGATVVHNLICSKAVPEMVLAAGGVPVRTRVGHSYIKEVMKETNAVFGGEHSGHYYFRDHFRADSGILAMLILLRVMSEAGVPLSELRQRYEPYAQSGEINLTVPDARSTLERVAAAITEGEVDVLDGVTVDLGGSAWYNLRPSNTEPLLRLNVEAADDASVAAIVETVKAMVAEVAGG